MRRWLAVVGALFAASTSMAAAPPPPLDFNSFRCNVLPVEGIISIDEM